MKILSFGEILWDCYPYKSVIGGAPLNFAAHLAKHNENVYMLSAVGNDELGTKAIDSVKNWNICADFIFIHNNKQTGRCDVTLDQNSVPCYNLLNDVAYDYIVCDKLPDEFDILYFGTLALRSEYNRNSLKKLLNTNSFAEIFVDINIRPPYYSKDTVEFSLKNATILKISDEELPTVCSLLNIDKISDYKAVAKVLSDRYQNLKCIIITLGAKGAFALDCITKKEFSCDSVKTDVVSTVGAGDSFSAAFLHKYLHKTEIDSCLTYASKIAGFVVLELEAVPEYDIANFQ